MECRAEESAGLSAKRLDIPGNWQTIFGTVVCFSHLPDLARRGEGETIAASHDLRRPLLSARHRPPPTAFGDSHQLHDAASLNCVWYC